MIPRLRVEGFEFFSHRTRTRFPFRYGIASMTEVPHFFIRARIHAEGHLVTGAASEGLPPKWFTKDPDTSFEQDLEEMLRVIGHAAELTLAAGSQPISFFDLWRDVYRAQSKWADQTHRAPLLSNLGVSLCERAVLDALCRFLDRPLHQVVRENLLGIRLGEVHPDLGSAEPAHLLPRGPSDGITVRHTVGLADALRLEDLPPSERVDDGLPQDLLACVRAYGLRAFKIKLSGNLSRDAARLRDIGSLLQTESSDDFIVTLDANENFRDFATFREFWQSLSADPTLCSLLAHTLLVEQPVHRAHALEENVGRILESWQDRPALIIDESDGALEDVPRALALGYDGASHKNCKGIIKGLVNACWIEHLRRSGRRLHLTGEDLCNLGPIALLQDYSVMALLGIPHVERNGHHYYRGLTSWPEEWQNKAAVSHPDLYIRDPAGFVRVEIHKGRVELTSVNAAPFGLKPLLDVDRFPRVQFPASRP